MIGPGGDNASRKPSVIFVLGGPGAGKGTQCQKLVDNHNFVHLSAGDLLRAERKNPESKHGQLIEEIIVAGKIVPVEITCTLLENAMNKHMQEEGKFDFLIDGFPRNEDNLQGWAKQMGDKVNERFCFFFNCSEQTCIDRVMGRAAAADVKRSDDNIEALRKRFHTYETSTMPIIKHFQSLNKCVEIDAGQSQEEVYQQVQKALKE